MSRHTVFTTVTPLPSGVTREIVLDFLRDHEEMIDLNPLVKERHPIPVPPHAEADELDCLWYSLTDKISYFPGVSGDITYTCAFHDLQNGVQTHCYAPAGLTIRDKWTVGGSLPGEPAPPVELGLKVPSTGLYLREDVDMACNVIMASFVKKTLKKSHAALVERLKIKAEIASTGNNRRSGYSKDSPNPIQLNPIGYDTAPSLNNHASHVASASAPTRRPSSAASSVSSYSLQSSPTWSQPTSSRGTSPALSAKSPPITQQGSGFQHPVQQRPAEYVAQPWRPFTAPQSEQLVAPVSASTPDTPFLRQPPPDWPLKSQPAAPAARPYTQANITAYRPPLGHPVATSPPPLNVETARNPAPVTRDELSASSLWKALGGGRFAAQNAAGYNANTSAKGHSRTQSQGHPDYPQMSPYDDETEGAGVPGMVRPVSVPPPLRLRQPMVATQATLSGLFPGRYE
ncbi:hypothetical protein C8A05DRAFT_15773 [Staphylotrichum tortipilum]|uniref:DUF7053 domain-containing protein n=1 Tax=Staphylotrichum tortipilum TaxID=2831512 RepID=A0AAN6MJN7_9PEZI|nr:hypothetical protein C8A05DRAFT_15773 [Staphylotrichum longicolle]